MNKVKVIEAFTSWQGEGNDTGKRMLILRFKNCNRKCPWCDTNVKMRISAEFDLSLKEIQKIVDQENAGLLITGGEPTYGGNFQQTISLINRVKANIYNVETNGCDLIDLIKLVNKNKNVIYSLSPKLFNDTDFMGYKRLVKELKDNKRVFIKLVTEDKPLVIEFLDYLKEIEFDMNRVFLMPEGTTKESIINHAPFVFDMAEKYKCNFSSREHIIYGFV